MSSSAAGAEAGNSEGAGAQISVSISPSRTAEIQAAATAGLDSQISNALAAITARIEDVYSQFDQHRLTEYIAAAQRRAVSDKY